MAYPDQLKTPVPARHPGSGALDDFLWEVAAWDPDAERILVDACREGTDAELAGAARRLLDSGVLTEPALVSVALQLLAEAGALRPDTLDATPGRMADLGSGPGGRGDRYRAAGPAVGRDSERSQGVRAVTGRGTGVRILGIHGPPGVGKTHLAGEVLADAALAGTGPRLAVRLTAPGPAGARPTARAGYDALQDALAELGVSEEDMPATLEGRRARYVGELTGTRPVILADAAADVSQVVPLLPPEAGVVVVTSRHPLPGLAELGAVLLPLEPLTRHGSRLLVRECFPDPGARPDEAALTAIHALCGGMPMPTMVVSRWVARTGAAEGLPPGALAERLGAAARQASESADSGLGLPASGTMSAVLGHLSDEERAVARVLGLLRVPEAGPRAVCLGTGLGQAQAQAALEQLAGLGLVERCGDGRGWVMPPLVADYVCAHASAGGRDIRIELEQVLGQVLGLYRWRAEGLRNLMAPQREPSPPLRAWADAQWQGARECFAALLAGAAACVRPALAQGLAAAFLDAVRRHGEWRETDRYLTPLLRVARDARDQRLEAMTLLRLGGDASRQGETASAATLLGAAREAARAAADDALAEEAAQALADVHPPGDAGPGAPPGARGARGARRAARAGW